MTVAAVLCVLFFPTCQVRVVRFYVSCPSCSSPCPSSSSLPAVGSARSKHGAPDCSGQRRTSTWSSRLQWAEPDLNSELPIAVSSAGPQPRAPDCSGQRRTSATTRYVKRYVRNMSAKNVRRYARRNVRRYVNRNVR